MCGKKTTKSALPSGGKRVDCGDGSDVLVQQNPHNQT